MAWQTQMDADISDRILNTEATEGAEGTEKGFEGCGKTLLAVVATRKRCGRQAKVTGIK